MMLGDTTVGFTLVGMGGAAAVYAVSRGRIRLPLWIFWVVFIAGLILILGGGVIALYPASPKAPAPSLAVAKPIVPQTSLSATPVAQAAPSPSPKPAAHTVRRKHRKHSSGADSGSAPAQAPQTIQKCVVNGGSINAPVVQNCQD